MARRRIWSVGSGPYWLRVVVSVGPAHSPTSGWLRPVESEREDLDTSHRLHLFLCRWDLTCICVPVQVYKNHTSVVPDSVFFFFLNSGSGSEIQFLSEAQDDPQKRKPDIKKAKLMLGWEPVVRWGWGYRCPLEKAFPHVYSLRALPSGVALAGSSPGLCPSSSVTGCDLDSWGICHRGSHFVGFT